jgi:thymidine kinase
MSFNTKSAYLEIILGGMYSGKTSRLVEVYKKYKLCDISVAVINHTIDNRYDDKMLSTHDQIKIPCIKTCNLLDLWMDYAVIKKRHIIPISNGMLQQNISEIERYEDKLTIIKSDVILINEGQFFSDLEEFVHILLENGKKIYVCGLDGDFERKKFGQLLDLIPLCDKVTKLLSLCSLCKNGTKGIFSKRITNEKEQTVVGSDNYIPVCRNCYEM